MNRHPKWEPRLTAFVEAARARPYAYGQWDCVLLCAGAVKAVTGKDPARGHRGKYRSPASAVRYLRSLGFDHPEQLIDSQLAPKPVGFAQRGDLVLCRTPSGDNPGVCMGDFALVVGQQGEAEGLVPVPRTLWLKAWAVGDHHSGPLKAPRKSRRKPRPLAAR